MLAVNLCAFLLLLVGISAENKECSTFPADQECTETEHYSTYLDCIRKRTKRHTDCESGCSGDDCGDDDCGQCDCNYCSYNDCSDDCSSCCENYQPPCRTRTCCQATCHMSCKTSHCRRSCRSRCQKSVEKHTITSASGSSKISVDNKLDSRTSAKHNITTVINLHNVVNNTNIVDMPVTVNNTNHNNITLQTPEQSPINLHMGPTHQHHTEHKHEHHTERTHEHHTEHTREHHTDHKEDSSKCCVVISPRQCIPTTTEPYIRCFHTKKTVCNDICQSAIMHAEPHPVCNEHGVNCHDQVSYIPQPQPRCISTSAWPYVSCSIARPSCTGCYSHLVHGGSAPQHCSSSCYDNGINVGPFYPPYFQNQAIPGGIPRMSCGMPGCRGPPGGSSGAWNELLIGSGGFNGAGMVMPMGLGGSFGMSGGMGVNPYDEGGIQSVGQHFDYSSHNLVPGDAHPMDTGHDDPFMKNKRSSDDEKTHEKATNEENYSVEEFPIKTEKSDS